MKIVYAVFVVVENSACIMKQKYTSCKIVPTMQIVKELLIS